MEREELISNIVDHYTYHACVMTLITPLNRPRPTALRQTLHSMTNWRTQGSLCQKTSSTLQNDPLCSHFPPRVLFPHLLVPLQTNARTRWILDNNPPPLSLVAKPPPFFLQVDTESPLLSRAAITYLSTPALLVLKLTPKPKTLYESHILTKLQG